MTAPDPLAIERRARELAAAYDPDVRERLSTDPVQEVGALYDLTVVHRARSGAACELDASYDADNGIITIDMTAPHSRQRFSCLHELAHHDIDMHDEISDWIYGLGSAQHDVLEQLCDAFAAEILLPSAEVAQYLGREFAARDVARLASMVAASREACVVRAAHALRGPGLVVLADTDGVVRFSSSRSLPMRIGRGVPQTATSVITSAGNSGTAASIAPEKVTLRSGESHTSFYGTAVATDDGYVFAVLRQADDDTDRRGVSFGQRRAWTCGRCRRDITDEPWCNTCNQRICDECGCICPPPPRSTTPRFCSECGMQIPLSKTDCDLHE